MKNIKSLFSGIFLQGILNNKLNNLDKFLMEKSLENIKEGEILITEKEKKRVMGLLEDARIKKIKNINI